MVTGKISSSIILVAIHVFWTVGSTFAKEPNQFPPQRIVSLNLCTDQLLMMLVEPSRIKAVSRYSLQPSMSVMAEQAANLHVTYGKAEEVFLLKPDLVLAGSFTSRPTINMLRKLKRKVVQLEPASSFLDIFRNIKIIGEAVGETVKADGLIAKLKSELLNIETGVESGLPLAALYFANGYSAGKNTLVDTVLQKSGFKTLGKKLDFRGTRKISLETLLFSQPDVLVFGLQKFPGEAMAFEVFKHPAMRYLKRSAATTFIADALTICGTPQTIKAVLRLRQFKRSINWTYSNE